MPAAFGYLMVFVSYAVYLWRRRKMLTDLAAFSGGMAALVLGIGFFESIRLGNSTATVGGLMMFGMGLGMGLQERRWFGGSRPLPTAPKSPRIFSDPNPPAGSLSTHRRNR